MKSGLSGASGFVTVTWEEETLEKAGVRLPLAPLHRSETRPIGKKAAKKSRKKVAGTTMRVFDVGTAVSSRRFEKRLPNPDGGIFETSSERVQSSRSVPLSESELLRRKIGG